MQLTLPKITIITVGKIKNTALAELSLDYQKRLSFDINIDIREIKDSDRNKESYIILQLIKKLNSYTIALSEEGKEYTSTDFTKKLNSIRRSSLAFVIGGPEGLSEEVKRSTDEIMSLSLMTFTHEMARVLLLEQLYRADCILNNRKYHR